MKISWKKKDENTVAFDIKGSVCLARNVKNPDLIVEILNKVTKFSSYEKSLIVDFIMNKL